MSFFVPMEIITIIALSLIIVVLLVLSYLERKDLVDRLMSKDIVEYKSIKEEQNEFGEENPNLIPIWEAKEEIMDESK